MVSPSAGNAVEAVPLVVNEVGAEHARGGASDVTGPSVIVLHGLLGSGRNWMTASRRLADRFHVVAPDLRNHGTSPWSSTMTYDAMAADVVALIEAGAGRVHLVGHSMGGKAAMVLALQRPDLVAGLVIVDVAPVTYPHTFEAYAAAMRAVDLPSVRRRADADAQLADAVPDPGVRAFLLQNLVLDSSGARWRVNLPVLQSTMPAISAFPTVADDAQFRGPTLFVAGEHSDYIRPEHTATVRTLFPAARFETVDGAGHWVHAERLDGFLAVLTPFLTAAS